MERSWGLPASQLLVAGEAAAAATLRASLGIDLFSQPEFWERIVARQLGGEPTMRKALHDVDVEIWGRACRAEVKYSTAFRCSFKAIRGKDWSREVFKWALPRGNSGKAGVDACILVGRDVDDRLFAWVVPQEHIAERCASITMTAPSARASSKPSRWDRYAVPWDAMLPAFARAAHNTYDMPKRRAGIAQRAREAIGCGDLFDEGGRP